MKRTPLRRKTPIKSVTVAKRKAPKKRTTLARWRSPEYIAWIKTLPCVICHKPGVDPHHVIGLHWGLSGGGLTAPDSFVMPACRKCHRQIHTEPELQQMQPHWLRHTIAMGIKQFDGEIRDQLMLAWRFIADREVEF